MAKIAEIEGVGPGFAEALAGAGVTTTEGLLTAGGTPAGRTALAEKSGIDVKKILEWVNHSDLMRIKGVGSEYADLLEAAGVDTVKELATRKPENLHAKMIELNTEKSLVRRPPTATGVSEWVAEAKTLPPGVSY